MSDQTVNVAYQQLEPEHDPALEHGASNRTYVIVALFLAVMTALEVTVSYTKDQLGVLHDWTLIVLMVIKFFTVALFFMHLRYDNKWCQRVFYAGLGTASLVYVLMLATFHYWASGFR